MFITIFTDEEFYRFIKDYENSLRAFEIACGRFDNEIRRQIQEEKTDWGETSSSVYCSIGDIKEFGFNSFRREFMLTADFHINITEAYILYGVQRKDRDDLIICNNLRSAQRTSEQLKEQGIKSEVLKTLCKDTVYDRMLQGRTSEKAIYEVKKDLLTKIYVYTPGICEIESNLPPIF